MSRPPGSIVSSLNYGGRGTGYGRGSGYHYGYGSSYGYGAYGRGRGYVGRHRHVYFPGYSYPRVYGSYFYFPGFHFGVGYGHAPYAYGGVGYGYSGYASPYGYYGGYSGHPADYYTGFLRLKVRPRHAEVYADGYFVGVVNEFDGIFQRLRLEEGPHHIEIRHPGYEPLELEVLIVPGQKVTYEGDLLPLP